MRIPAPTDLSIPAGTFLALLILVIFYFVVTRFLKAEYLRSKRDGRVRTVVEPASIPKAIWFAGLVNTSGRRATLLAVAPDPRTECRFVAHPDR
jgi:hypothetical protein